MVITNGTVKIPHNGVWHAPRVSACTGTGSKQSHFCGTRNFANCAALLSAFLLGFALSSITRFVGLLPPRPSPPPPPPFPFFALSSLKKSDLSWLISVVLSTSLCLVVFKQRCFTFVHFLLPTSFFIMHLMFYLDPKGNRVYTLKVRIKHIRIGGGVKYSFQNGILFLFPIISLYLFFSLL